MTSIKQEMDKLEGDDTVMLGQICIAIHDSMRDDPERRVPRLLAMLACNAGCVLAPLVNEPGGKEKIEILLADFLAVTAQQMDQVAGQMRRGW